MVSAAKVDRKPKLSEAHIKQTCSEWLALDGWRWIDTDPPGLRGLGVREIGIADRLYIRYWSHRREPQPHDQRVNALHLASGNYVMWIEWKKLRALPMRHQSDWHARERAKGALTLIAGRDFPATIEGFQEWYRQSGLAWRVR